MSSFRFTLVFLHVILNKEYLLAKLSVINYEKIISINNSAISSSWFVWLYPVARISHEINDKKHGQNQFLSL